MAGGDARGEEGSTEGGTGEVKSTVGDDSLEKRSDAREVVVGGQEPDGVQSDAESIVESEGIGH